MTINLIIFALYLLIAGNTTYFMGKSLHHHGEAFLKSIFMSRPDIVQPVNNILLVGFYLVNLGFVLLFFTQQNNLPDWLSGFEFLCRMLGSVYMVLGCMHFFNILVFVIIERHSSPTQH